MSPTPPHALTSELTESAQTSKLRTSFLAFLVALFSSRLADQVLLFVVPLVVFEVTQDVGWSGLAFAAETFPRFLSFPICGALCDRVSPIKLMRVSQVYRAVVCVGGVGASLVFGGIGWLIALSAVCGVLTTQGAMAREVLLPQVFKAYRFEKLLAYSQTADQAGAVLGPVVAALILSWWGWESVVLAAAGGFILADVAMTVWKRTSRASVLAPEVTKGWAAPIKTAVAQVVSLPGLLRLVILAAGVNMIVGVTLASSAALVTGSHQQTAGYYAGLQTAGATATIIILLVIAHTSMPLKSMGVVAFGLIFVGGMVTAISPDHWTYAIGFLLIIGFDKMFNIYIRSHRQKIIPPRDYGKTTGVIVLLNNLTQPLAGLALGLSSGFTTPGGLILILTMLMGLLGIAAAMTGPPPSLPPVNQP